MVQVVLLVAVYICIALLPLVLLIVSGPGAGNGVVFDFGRSIALAAFPMVLVQPILIARFSWIDGPAGRVNTLRFHQAMGVAALVGLLSHPVTLALGGSGIALLDSLALPWFVLVGKATLAALLFHVGLALFRINIGMTYPTWKRVHTGTAPLIITGAFIHSWFAGSDLSLRALQAYWIALLVVAAAMVAYQLAQKR